MSIDEKLITNEVLNNTLKKEAYPEIRSAAQPKIGKVRVVYDVGNAELIGMTSDDLSTHDVVHKRQVYAKGENLNAISAYYFDLTQGIIPNHLIRRLAPNTWLMQKAEPILVEMVFRKYLTGSGWKAYKENSGPEKGCEFCGVQLRTGYRKNEMLDKVIFTPTGKGRVKDFPIPEFAGMDSEEDDPKLTTDVIRKNFKAFGLRKPEDLDFVTDAAFKLYHAIHADLESKDELLADTKWEFGYSPNGTIMLIDECVTPDSSRFWKKSQYVFVPEKNEFRIVQGDKQPFRDYIERLGLHKPEKKQELAEHWMDDDVLRQGVIRYCNMRETITGTKTEITTVPRKEVIMQALDHAGYLR